MITIFSDSDLKKVDIPFDDVKVHSFRGSNLSQYEFADLVLFIDGRDEHEPLGRMKILKNRYPNAYLSSEQLEAAKRVVRYAFDFRRQLDG